MSPLPRCQSALIFSCQDAWNSSTLLFKYFVYIFHFTIVQSKGESFHCYGEYWTIWTLFEYEHFFTKRMHRILFKYVMNSYSFQVKKMVRSAQEVIIVGGSHALHRHEKLAIAVFKAMRGHSLHETKSDGRFHVHTRTYLDGAVLKEVGL